MNFVGSLFECLIGVLGWVESEAPSTLQLFWILPLHFLSPLNHLDFEGIFFQWNVVRHHHSFVAPQVLAWYFPSIRVEPCSFYIHHVLFTTPSSKQHPLSKSQTYWRAAAMLNGEKLAVSPSFRKTRPITPHLVVSHNFLRCEAPQTVAGWWFQIFLEFSTRKVGEDEPILT